MHLFTNGINNYYLGITVFCLLFFHPWYFWYFLSGRKSCNCFLMAQFTKTKLRGLADHYFHSPIPHKSVQSRPAVFLQFCQLQPQNARNTKHTLTTNQCLPSSWLIAHCKTLYRDQWVAADPGATQFSLQNKLLLPNQIFNSRCMYLLGHLQKERKFSVFV